MIIGWLAACMTGHPVIRDTLEDAPT